MHPHSGAGLASPPATCGVAFRALGAPFLCALLLTTSGARLAHGAGRIVSPGAGDSVVAGGAADVRWEALPADVDELELFLSLDDGQSFPIRLTPQLGAGPSSHVWRVPNLASSTARLRVRYGVGGREIDGEPGGSFRIVPRADRPPAALQMRAGELWSVPNYVPPAPAQESPSRGVRESPRLGDSESRATLPSAVGGADLGVAAFHPGATGHSAGSDPHSPAPLSQSPVTFPRRE